MTGIVVEKKGRRVRVNTRTWVRPSGDGLAPSEGVNLKHLEAVQIDVDKEYEKVVAFAGKKGIALSGSEPFVFKTTTSLLFLMGRKALLTRFFSWKAEKHKEYLSNPYLFYLQGLLDFHSSRVISLRTGCPSSLVSRIAAYTYFVLDGTYREGRESIGEDELVARLSECMDEDGETIDGLMETAKTAKFKGKRKAFYSDGYAYMAWIYFLRERALKLLRENGEIDPPGDADPRIRKLLSHRYSCLTGGAGTGKTTLLRKIASMGGLRVVLSATTGKAAKNLGQEASTLHSLLGFSPSGFTVKHLDCDLLLVDEASMLDWRTLHAALRAAPRIVFSGDPAQLPPVEGESVFRRIVEMAPMVTLSRRWRFREGGPVVARLDVRDEQTALNRLGRLVRFRKDKEVQVITPVHHGLLGTRNLNRYLQALVNPSDGPSNGIRKGDRVIVTRNIYLDGELVASNGQTGVALACESIEGKRYVVAVLDGEKALFVENDLDLAYALTVHRFQGSECDYVIFVVPRIGGDFLTDELLHVGKTRARVKTWVIAVST